MLRSPIGIFQFESAFAFDSLRKFKTHSIYDMSLVTACIRPSGASYRDELLQRKPHHNPSPIIDDLLKDNLGYLIYRRTRLSSFSKSVDFPAAKLIMCAAPLAVSKRTDWKPLCPIFWRGTAPNPPSQETLLRKRPKSSCRSLKTAHLTSLGITTPLGTV